MRGMRGGGGGGGGERMREGGREEVAVEGRCGKEVAMEGEGDEN